MRHYVTTASSVTAGHPDKLCDQISDAVLDACLVSGHRSGLVVETAISANIVFLSIRSGEEVMVDAAALARRLLEEAGHGDDGQTAPSVILDHVVSPELSSAALAKDPGQHFASGFGYACRDGPGGMPFAISLAHEMTLAMDTARLAGDLSAIASDAEAHAAVKYVAGHARDVLKLGVRARPLAHDRRSEAEEALRRLAADVLERMAAGRVSDVSSAILIQLDQGPAGLSLHGGQTGRKLSVDTYGGYVRSSSSALSGKDPSRIDRTANYAARHAAKCLVAAGLVEECEVELNYIPGEARPISVSVDSFGTGQVPDDRLTRRLTDTFDFRPAQIALRYDLWELPRRHNGRFYRTLSCHGQIGRQDVPCPWEDTDLSQALV